MIHTASIREFPPSTAAPSVWIPIVASVESEVVRKSQRIYLLIGVLLFCGTIATFSVATVPALDMGARGFDKWDGLLALGIATFKASLVAAVFMHLNHERRTIYALILLGSVVVSGLFFGTYLHFVDSTRDDYFYGDRNSPTVGTTHGANNAK